jgi:hypothetical protein
MKKAGVFGLVLFIWLFALNSNVIISVFSDIDAGNSKFGNVNMVTASAIGNGRYGPLASKEFMAKVLLPLVIFNIGIAYCLSMAYKQWERTHVKKRKKKR